MRVWVFNSWRKIKFDDHKYNVSSNDKFPIYDFWSSSLVDFLLMKFLFLIDVKINVWTDMILNPVLESMQVLRKLHFSPHKFAIKSFEVLLSYFDLLDMDSEMQKNSISTWFRHLPGAHDAHLMELEWFWGLGNW